jgi:hypothetical protein
MSRYWVWHKLYEGIWVIKRGFITFSELEKIFYLFLNNIDCKTLNQCGMRFEKSFNFYSKNHDYSVKN